LDKALLAVIAANENKKIDKQLVDGVSKYFATAIEDATRYLAKPETDDADDAGVVDGHEEDDDDEATLSR
jgi:hypothetical protein